MSDTDLTIYAILVYAVYRCINTARHGHCLTEDQVYDMLEEYSKTSVRGHSKSSAVLFRFAQGRFIPPRPLPL